MVNYFYKCESCESLIDASSLIKSNNDFYCPICGENMHLTINGYIKGSGTGRGGWRGGGRPKSDNAKTEKFSKRVTPEEKLYLEECLRKYRNKNA